MSDGVEFWVATFETPSTQTIAYGATPEKALEALVDLWVGKHCPASDADPAYPWELKDDIAIGKATLGHAYMLSNHDRFWYPDNLAGSDTRLDATWDSLAERYGVFPASLEDASNLLRKAFTGLKGRIETDKPDFGRDGDELAKAMRHFEGLASEDPATVDHQVLVESADNLRILFAGLRTIALAERDPKAKEHRREHALLYHRMSYDLTRFSAAIAGMRDGAVPGMH